MFRRNFSDMSPRRRTVSVIFFCLFILLLMGYLIVSGIHDLTDSSGVKEAYIDMSSESMALEHSINGLIPTGTEYFYVGIDSASGDMYIIRAGKHWFDDNFDSSNHTAPGSAVKITARSARVDYEVSKELASAVGNTGELNFVTGTSYCYDTLYKTIAVKKLITAVLLVLASVSFVIYMKIRDQGYKWVTCVAGVFLIAAGVMLINVFTYV